MKIIPAIDILDGKVVRLIKGSYQEKKEYSDDPVSMAQSWQSEGAEYLHIVDLDGAKSGEPKNAQIIENIIKKISIPVEVGGGIRTPEHINLYINLGVGRVVLGTAVIRDLSFLDKKEIQESIEKISISFDARIEGDEVMSIMMAGTSGWQNEIPILDYRGLIDRIVSAKIKYFNYTDRLKDGTLSGLSKKDISSLDTFLSQISDRDIEVIYAGGIASLEDIIRIARLKQKKLAGLIVGKALYEGRFSLKDAQKEISKI